MSITSNSKRENSVEKIDTKKTKYYIATNNSLMNEIQELLTDQEIISKKLIKENKDDYTLELIFPEEITQKNFKIKFLLIISKDYPNKEPELYCLTMFSHPHLCDGRNLINNIINGDWSNKKLPLETLMMKLLSLVMNKIRCLPQMRNLAI
jgi:ubiquitin-protein ligase